MDTELKKGDRVTIKKGAVIKSTYFKSPTRRAGRAYTVKLHDVYPARQVFVGHRDYNADGTVNYESFNFNSKSDRYLIEETFGTSDIEQFREQLRELGIALRRGKELP